MGCRNIEREIVVRGEFIGGKRFDGTITQYHVLMIGGHNNAVTIDKTDSLEVQVIEPIKSGFLHLPIVEDRVDLIFLIAAVQILNGGNMPLLRVVISHENPFGAMQRTHATDVRRFHVAVDIVAEIGNSILGGHLEQHSVVLGVGPVEVLGDRIGGTVIPFLSEYFNTDRISRLRLYHNPLNPCVQWTRGTSN